MDYDRKFHLHRPILPHSMSSLVNLQSGTRNIHDPKQQAEEKKATKIFLASSFSSFIFVIIKRINKKNVEKFSSSLNFFSVLDFFIALKISHSVESHTEEKRYGWHGRKAMARRRDRKGRETKSFDYFSPSSSSKCSHNESSLFFTDSNFKENITNGIIMFSYYKNVITFMTTQ